MQTEIYQRYIPEMYDNNPGMYDNNGRYVAYHHSQRKVKPLEIDEQKDVIFWLYEAFQNKYFGINDICKDVTMKMNSEYGWRWSCIFGKPSNTFVYYEKLAIFELDKGKDDSKVFSIGKSKGFHIFC